jgi:ABC-2 type transport system permease protein
MTARTAGGGTTEGAGTLLRFMLRRERRGLPWWLLGVGLLLAYQSMGSQSLYDSPEALAELRATLGGNATVVALSGPTELLETIGGEVAFEIFAYVAIVVALMNMFLVGRHTRSDEEAGRAELVRSGRVGRHATLAAVLLLAGLANLAVALVAFVAGTGTGLPVGGSALLGVALAGVGITFAGLTAVAAQVFENTRGMYGTVTAILGASYVLRAVGDIGDEAWSWLSPIGWGQRTLPYVGDRWWPLLIPLAVAALLASAAVALLNRRDFGAGIVPARPGRATASGLLGSPLGLAWRLHRGSFIGWAIGIVLLAAVFGSLGKTMEEFVAENPQVAEFLGGGARIFDSFIALSMVISGLLAAAFGVITVLRARGEETSGRAEPVLATPTSRRAWLGSHVTVALAGSTLIVVAAGFFEGLTYGLSISDPDQIPRLTAISLVYVPAVWSVIGLAVLGLGLLPRVAATVAWVVVGYCSIVALFADSFDMPTWAQDVSPFEYTPAAPLASVTATPLLVLGAVVAVLVSTGFIGFRRRDVGY